MSTSDIPEGFTDDCSVQLRPGCSLEALVDFVIERQVTKVSPDITVQELATRFVIEDDAAFALDRVLGGIARAATGNPANCPDCTKDPVAWTSYQRAIREPVIIAAIRPEYVRKKSSG
jgi:hypothetical protein